MEDHLVSLAGLDGARLRSQSNDPVAILASHVLLAQLGQWRLFLVNE